MPGRTQQTQLKPCAQISDWPPPSVMPHRPRGRYRKYVNCGPRRQRSHKLHEASWMDTMYSGAMVFVATATNDVHVSELRQNLRTVKDAAEMNKRKLALFQNSRAKAKIRRDCYAGLRRMYEQSKLRVEWRWQQPAGRTRHSRTRLGDESGMPRSCFFVCFLLPEHNTTTSKNGFLQILMYTHMYVCILSYLYACT